MTEKIKNRELGRQSTITDGQIKYTSTYSSFNCPNCNKSVSKLFELCPECGYRLHKNHCTYCGAPMTSDDLYCGECGGNTKGIKCPSCGTLSFRSFCPKCNCPVDELGKNEYNKAQADPLYQRICVLAQRIIDMRESVEINKDVEQDLSPEIRSLLQRYASIHEKGSKIVTAIDNEYVEDQNEFHNKGTESNKIILSDYCADITGVASAIEELNSLLKEMIPDPGLPPQMQRNYFSARKVAVYRKSKIRETVGWVCNLCGCHHSAPSECARPELGGTWIYQEKEITTKTYE